MNFNFSHFNCIFFFKIKAQSAYNFKERAKCLKNAFSDIQQVEVLEKFANFRDAVKSLLNRPTETPGQIETFWMLFRPFIFLLIYSCNDFFLKQHYRFGSY